MAGALSDEVIARKLQAKFDNDEVIRQKQEREDKVLAMSYYNSHNISDSDSDSSEQSSDIPTTVHHPRLFSSVGEGCSTKNGSVLSTNKSNLSEKNRKRKSDDNFNRTPSKKSKQCVNDSKHERLSISPHSLLKGKSSSDISEMTGLNKTLLHKTCSEVSKSISGASSSKLISGVKPNCPYKSKCFRKNSSHLSEFNHSEKKNESVRCSLKKSGMDIFNENQPLSFYMTKVTGVEDIYNSYGAIGIKDILSPSMGQLQSSCQFNYMYDISWLMQQYPSEYRKKPLTLVHGEQRGGLATLLAEASPYPNITCCQAKLEIMYGTHHTKMMFLLYDTGLRVVIHTSNLVENDWFQKSQGVWISPVFPKLPSTVETVSGDSATHFKRELLQYLTAYKSSKLTIWKECIAAHDMSAARVHIIGSVPGRHTGEQKSSWGHLKLRKILKAHVPEEKHIQSWPVIGQFSSIGSLGPRSDTWVMKEWIQSLSASRAPKSIVQAPDLTLVFPSVENVRVSLEGYPGGGCIPYNSNTARKQLYIHPHFRQWKSDGRGRTMACPHIKTYFRPSPDFKKIAWFLVTSANLSKAAWGALEKNENQLMIRSYEIGVLFLPQEFNCDKFPVTSDAEEAILRSEEHVFPLPFDLPLIPYNKGDRPWMIDIPCIDAPDTHGNMWCPPFPV